MKWCFRWLDAKLNILYWNYEPMLTLEDISEYRAKGEPYGHINILKLEVIESKVAKALFKGIN